MSRSVPRHKCFHTAPSDDGLYNVTTMLHTVTEDGLYNVTYCNRHKSVSQD